MNRMIVTALISLAAVSLMGCKAQQAGNTQFVQSELMKHDPSLPFHKVWRKQNLDWKQYSKIHIAPVNTSYMLKLTEWDKGVHQDDIVKDLAKLGVYARNSMIKAFGEDPARRYQVVDAPGKSKDTIILEVALTEVVPSKVVLNALGFAPMGIGLGINAVRAMADDRSTVAFEARVRDASTGQIIATVADREAQQAAAANIKDFTWYSHAESIIDNWSRQFVQIANRKPGEKIEDTEAFTILPW